MLPNLNQLDGAFTVTQFLEAFPISRSTFYSEVREGRLPLYRLGRRSLVARSAACAWWEAIVRGERAGARIAGQQVVEPPPPPPVRRKRARKS